MNDNHILPDKYTMSTLLKGMKRNLRHKQINETLSNILIWIKDCRNDVDIVLCNNLLDFLNEFSGIEAVETGYEIIKEMHIQPTHITFGILIKA